MFDKETRRDLCRRREKDIERQLEDQIEGIKEKGETADTVKFDASMILHSEQARTDLEWPTWGQRRAAARAAFASGVMERQQPKALAEV